jgi:simple sugar transport system permease protein
VLVGAGIVGVAGALLSVHYLQGFTQNMVAGRGWIAFAIVIFGRWRPVSITLGCLLFAGIFALQIRLQTMGINLPSELMTALPYFATLLMLTIIMSQSRSFKMPSALGLPYYRE